MDPIFITTLQKTGTHLIMQPFKAYMKGWFQQAEGLSYSHMVRHLAEPSGENIRGLVSREDTLEYMRNFTEGVCVSHLPFDPEIYRIFQSNNVKVVWNIRDPRAQAISHVHQARSNPIGRANFTYHDGSRLNDKPDPILAVLKTMPERWGAFLPWIKHAAIVMKYEGLRIYPQWGVEWMWHRLGKDAMVKAFGTATQASDRIDPKNSPTFRVGNLEDWKVEFEPHHHQWYAENMGEIHERIGYSL